MDMFKSLVVFLHPHIIARREQSWVMLREHRRKRRKRSNRRKSAISRIPPEWSGGRRRKSDYLWELQGNISVYPAVIWLTEQAGRAKKGRNPQQERWLPRRVRVCRRWRCVTRRFIQKHVHNVQPIHVTSTLGSLLLPFMILTRCLRGLQIYRNCLFRSSRRIYFE